MIRLVFDGYRRVVARARHLDIPWRDGDSVPAAIAGSGDIGIVLAHGAGAGREHPFMVGMRDRLASEDFTVLAFDYPYLAAGRRAPDRLPVLVEAHTAVAQHLAQEVEVVVLAGKSMGGRVGSHVEAMPESPRVFYGYPLVPIGKTEPRDTTHLDALTGPMLFIQGERDRMAPLDAVTAVAKRVGATLQVIPDADHSFKVPKRTGLTEDDVLDRLAEITVGWLQVASS